MKATTLTRTTALTGADRDGPFATRRQGAAFTRKLNRLALPALGALLLLSGGPAIAGSATWLASPGTGDWNTNGNWTPATVPKAAGDTAAFFLSNTTAVSVSANTQVDTIAFSSGASAYTITASTTGELAVTGTGITNSSGITQNFVTAVDGIGNRGLITFLNGATTGTLTAFTNNGGAFNGALGGSTDFNQTSSAGSATFTNNGGTASGARGGFTDFFNTSSAGSGTFTSNGGTISGANGGVTDFNQSSDAGSATLIATGNVSGAGGGSIFFNGASTGGTAAVRVFGNGNLDISAHTGSLTIGSLEGTGDVFLGARNLTVGSNNASTLFSDVMQDGGFNGGAGGSFAKTGSGTLTLTGSNSYTGVTTVNGGTLVLGAAGSLTGAATVTAGTLAGSGGTAGAVTIGDGAGGHDAFLSPGNSPGAFTTTSSLSLLSDSTYTFELNSATGAADKIAANGVSIDSTALFSFTDLGDGSGVTSGMQFTAIDNTSGSAISGTFGNLADNATVFSNGITYTASYEGGIGGNDLVLTAIVPEPSTWAMVFVGAGLLLGFRRFGTAAQGQGSVNNC